MEIRVVEFSIGGYKIRKIFALESTYPKGIIEFSDCLCRGNLMLMHCDLCPKVSKIDQQTGLLLTTLRKIIMSKCKILQPNLQYSIALAVTQTNFLLPVLKHEKWIQEIDSDKWKSTRIQWLGSTAIIQSRLQRILELPLQKEGSKIEL